MNPSIAKLIDWHLEQAAQFSSWAEEYSEPGFRAQAARLLTAANTLIELERRGMILYYDFDTTVVHITPTLSYISYPPDAGGGKSVSLSWLGAYIFLTWGCGGNED